MVQFIVIDNREILCADVVEFSRFKEWVEDTALFDAIKKGTNDARNALIGYRIETPDMTLTLARDRIVNKFEDLPIEIVKQFYINSPWFNNNQSIQNLLEP